MTLPRPPISATTPIPNQPFSSESKPTLKGPYWQVALGDGLDLGGNGNAIVSTGGGGGQALPDFLPYGCRTDVKTSGITDFTEAWLNCYSLTTFPLLDVSSGTNFSLSWFNCSNLTSFPLLDVSSGTDFGGAWAGCSSLTSFPLLDVSSGTNFGAAWAGCTSLTTFPAGMFDSCLAINFNNAWYNCALNQTSVDNILISLDTAGQSGGIVNIDGGTSSAPGAAGLAAKASLQAKGWTVTTN